MSNNAISGTESGVFDVVVIGAGPVGENVADRVVQGGISLFRGRGRISGPRTVEVTGEAIDGEASAVTLSARHAVVVATGSSALVPDVAAQAVHRNDTGRVHSTLADEVASVGLTAAAAAEAGVRVRAVDYDLGAVAGAALYADGYEGHAGMVVDEQARLPLLRRPRPGRRAEITGCAPDASKVELAVTALLRGSEREAAPQAMSRPMSQPMSQPDPKGRPA